MRKLKKAEKEAIFEQLDALGWISADTTPRNGPNSTAWIVNPAVTPSSRRGPISAGACCFRRYLSETAAATTAEGDEHEITFNGYGARRSPTPRWFDRVFQPAGHGHTARPIRPADRCVPPAHHTRTGGSSIGENPMRSALALSLLITLCYSADAATVHHLRTHHRHHHITSGFAQSFGYEPARPPVHDYAPAETRPPATTYGGAPLLPDD